MSSFKLKTSALFKRSVLLLTFFDVVLGFSVERGPLDEVHKCVVSLKDYCSRSAEECRNFDFYKIPNEALENKVGKECSDEIKQALWEVSGCTALDCVVQGCKIAKSCEEDEHPVMGAVRGSLYGCGKYVLDVCGCTAAYRVTAKALEKPQTTGGEARLFKWAKAAKRGVQGRSDVVGRKWNSLGTGQKLLAGAAAVAGGAAAVTLGRRHGDAIAKGLGKTKNFLGAGAKKAGGALATVGRMGRSLLSFSPFGIPMAGAEATRGVVNRMMFQPKKK